jgi:hypothetical protein
VVAQQGNAARKAWTTVRRQHPCRKYVAGKQKNDRSERVVSEGGDNLRAALATPCTAGRRERCKAHRHSVVLLLTQGSGDAVDRPVRAGSRNNDVPDFGA